MTEELKADVEDMKDYAQQAKLEAKIKGRNKKTEVLKDIVDITGHELTTQEKIEGAKMVARDQVHNAEDFGKQVVLEGKMKARDTKVAIKQSETKQAADKLASDARDAIVDAKDTVVDALKPATKTVEAASTRGIDITHIENNNNEQLEARRQEELYRARRDEERAKEVKRQEILDSVKEKGAIVADKAKEIGEKAAVLVGKAALDLKEGFENATDDRPREKVTPRISESGIDTTSIQNPRNEEITATLQRQNEVLSHMGVPVEKEETKTEKMMSEVRGAVDALKEKFHDATTTSIPALYEQKTSATGIDISHMENRQNAELQAQDVAKAKQEKELQMARDKAAIQTRLVEPAKESMEEKSTSLKEKLSAAASKVSAAVKEKWQEIAHPVPLDVHEKKSENGIDTTSIANANNNAIGERIKAEREILPSSEEGKLESESTPSLATHTAAGNPKDAGTISAQRALDVGVTAKDAKDTVKDEVKLAGHTVANKAQEAEQSIANAVSK